MDDIRSGAKLEDAIGGCTKTASEGVRVRPAAVAAPSPLICAPHDQRPNPNYVEAPPNPIVVA
ncbi:hypothetical protein E2562_015206 [Oryza meyeriana var. granulata]|uniref:Uncharacterized protein n=1 Tax=Oryza meyeriana var. granulata TaxID=110450 RepID=A0A6G1EWT7_9ORYZ|nr:hypothetical protein E2562_015206 [Oryza meyeriana var. granulata]